MPNKMLDLHLHYKCQERIADNLIDLFYMKWKIQLDRVDKPFVEYWDYNIPHRMDNSLVDQSMAYNFQKDKGSMTSVQGQ